MDSKVKHILAFIGFIIVVAGIAYAVYKFFFEDKGCKFFLDDIEDAFDDDPFDDMVLEDE